MLLPDCYFKSVCDITPQFLASRGVRALLLDIDNTLTRDFSAELPEPVAAWLSSLKASGISAAIISNNGEERVAPFAAECSLPFLARAGKPLRSAFKRSCELLGCTAAETAVVGDQLFTDIAFGNLSGCLTIFVEPMGPETLAFVKFKRILEWPLMGAVRRRGKGR